MNASILKELVADYKKSFALIIDNKWLYGTILFFVACDVIFKIPSLIGQKFLLTQTLGNTIINNGVNQYVQQSITAKLFYATHSIHPLSVLGSTTFPALFGVLGLVVAFLLFFKKIKILRSTGFIKKTALYSALALLVGAVITLIALFFLGSQILVLLGSLIALVSIGVLSILLLTIVESAFIALLSRLLSREPISFELLSEHSVKFFRPLFIFNLVLYFISTNFVNQVILLPNYLHMIMPGSMITFNNLLFSNLSWIAYYFHPIFVVLFIFTPLIMAISSETKFISLLKADIDMTKRNLGYYLILFIWTLLLMFIILALSNFINPTVLLNSRPMIIEIISVGIYSLLFTFILMSFYVTAFRKILGKS
ncbi:hypothetical protein KGQ27_00110 [Patescibacteria group bacterium]|nr:hypothetical protein [Patescibacteria group bacterium]MDE1946620.1 hypothetical protein [Patescibacteria group bacterium]MDE2010574.1 hypothetical protein [Patescibacteria group bacterium]MDE2233162.1 hypothetical protein [Patescibacteria group bacterium]